MRFEFLDRAMRVYATAHDAQRQIVARAEMVQQ